MIKNMSDTTFKLSPVEYSEVVKFFNDKTGMNLTPVFEQYVKHAQIPTFYYTLKKKRNGYKMKYRWVANVKDFNMPMDVMISGKKVRLYPTMKLQKMKVDDEIQLLPEKFYVRM
jgi:hypothetical protein